MFKDILRCYFKLTATLASIFTNKISYKKGMKIKSSSPREIWMRGFEPPPPCTPCKCATRLRYTQETRFLQTGNTLKLEFAFLEFSNANLSTFFYNNLHRILGR
ncbi:CT631 hypothetical protein [Chlamydia pneumoniae J138]|nr:CT631 hypothetical protein [Chlamydia pneumoniae J138]